MNQLVRKLSRIFLDCQLLYMIECHVLWGRAEDILFCTQSFYCTQQNGRLQTTSELIEKKIPIH